MVATASCYLRLALLCLEQRLCKVLMRDLPRSYPAFINKRVIGCVEKLAGEPDKRQGIEAKLLLFDNARLKKMRRDLEQTEVGRLVIKYSDEKRLYAVLKPTREENVQRIMKVLSALDAIMEGIVFDRVKDTITAYQVEIKDRENGQTAI
jgi:hypothetical protein